MRQMNVKEEVLYNFISKFSDEESTNMSAKALFNLLNANGVRDIIELELTPLSKIKGFKGVGPAKYQMFKTIKEAIVPQYGNPFTHEEGSYIAADKGKEDIQDHNKDCDKLSVVNDIKPSFKYRIIYLKQILNMLSTGENIDDIYAWSPFTIRHTRFNYNGVAASGGLNEQLTFIPLSKCTIGEIMSKQFIFMLVQYKYPDQENPTL